MSAQEIIDTIRELPAMAVFAIEFASGAEVFPYRHAVRLGLLKHLGDFRGFEPILQAKVSNAGPLQSVYMRTLLDASQHVDALQFEAQEVA